MRKKIVLALLGVALILSAQTPVNPSSGPPPAPWVKLFCDATSCTSAYSTLAYICYAQQPGPTVQWTRAAGTLTSIVNSSNTSTVTTSTAHALWIGAHVTIAGVTTSGGTSLNGSYVVLTVPTSATFTITTAGVTDTTYTDATMTLTTTSPLITAPQWAIMALAYSGSALMSSYWENAGVGPLLACSDRAKY